MSDFIDIRKTTDIGKLQETVAEQQALVERLRGRIKYLENELKQANATIQSQQGVVNDALALSQMTDSTLRAYEDMFDSYRKEAALDAEVIEGLTGALRSSNRSTQSAPGAGLPMSTTPGVFRPDRGPTGSFMTHGVGMSYRKGEGTKVYRVQDPNGPLIPEMELVGAELEAGYDEGIHFGLQFKRKSKKSK